MSSILKKTIYFLTVFSFLQTAQALERTSIQSLHRSLETGALTCTKFVEKSINNIKTFNFSEKSVPINAFVSINPSIVERAKQLDKYYKAHKKFIGPLHCVTVVLKDNIDSTETPSSSGTLALIGNKPLEDAVLVKKLKENGALIIGKGAMDELASGIFGISSRSGRVGNAYSSKENPGGSSAGVAAAVSAGFAIAGIGSDNSGSIRIPALFNGLYGLRPSQGLISNVGTFPRGNIDGVYGPITNNLEDLSVLLDVLTEKEIKPVDINPTVGIVTKLNDKEIVPGDSRPSYLQRAIHHLERLGFKVKDIQLHGFDADRSQNSAGERDEINTYLASFSGARTNYQEICQSGRAPILGDEKSCQDFIRLLPAKNSKVYEQAVARVNKNRKLLQSQMKEHGVDILLSPITTSGHASYDDTEFYTWRFPLSSSSGLPALALPTEFNMSLQLPVGLQLIGQYKDEKTLIYVGQKFSAHHLHLPLPNLSLHRNTKLEDCTITDINNLITKIGTSSLGVLKQGTNYSELLTPEVFYKIYHPIIQKQVCGYLLA